MGWDNPPIRWREFERRLTWDSGTQAPAPEPKPRVALVAGAKRKPWAELHAHSSYSFLDGASSPAELVKEAGRRGVSALALTDHDGMYGAVQFKNAAAGTGLRTVFGAELSVGLLRPQSGVPDPEGRHLLVLARGDEGYRRLCSVISAAQLAGGAKGRPVYDLEALVGRNEGRWAVLTGCRKGPVPAALAEHGPEAAEVELRRMVDMFGRDNVFVELIDHDQPLDDARNDALYELAARVKVGVVASNNVHYARPRDARPAQALAAVRSRRGLDDMASWLPATGTAHIRDAEEMAARLARFPGVLERTVELAEQCAFEFDLLAPSLPNWEIPGGHDEATQLRRLVAEGARRRYGPPEIAPHAHRQITHELRVIEELGFPGYFLIVHDIVAFCAQENILCQGRGSAANSAVCYALGITNADPIRYKLLFERFLSPGRDGPPDIDVDIEHRRREEVIQYVYRRYGRDRAAQVANVISYRPRMAVRDAARALGFSPGQQDAWSKQIGPGRDVGSLDGAVPADAGIPAPVIELAERMSRLPRHLGIHSGGMVICDRPVGEVCPVEWATMPDRSVLQWDKDDCAGAGLVKFDLLGLGMLSCLHDAFDLVAVHGGVRYDLDSIPKEDRAVYDMLDDADSVGVFQVESRAQMATLPRLRPRNFYDLVVEVALIRPGPIQGGSVHPYIRRRNGREPVTYPHETMRPALGRTLGVPLFQEQMMQLAVDCAGFSPGEADRLRQAMSSKRAPERIEELRERLLTGMAANGISGDVAEDVYQKILGFASFGFPESHAISFALLVYASAWLKRYHPAAFTAALLRNQPMGFYHPQTLLADARRHGVRVRGVDINASDVAATLEEAVPAPSDHPHAPGTDQPVIRVGLSSVRNLGKDAAKAVAAGRPYADLDDFARRTNLSGAAVEALATAGAFDAFGMSRRAALWAAGAVARVRDGQLPDAGLDAPPLPDMTPEEETIADLWATGVSAVHPIAHLRAELDARGAVPASGLRDIADGTHISVGGMVTHRQHPATAGGVVFCNLEDETGMTNVICPPYVWERHRRTALESAALIIYGRLERGDGAVNLVATRMRALSVTRVTGGAQAPSRDFR